MKFIKKSAFLIPADAKKSLGENGWEFYSNFRIPSFIMDHIIKVLNLSFVEKYLCIETYANQEIKASIFYDANGLIEIIYFQARKNSLRSISNAFNTIGMPVNLELFIPSHGIYPSPNK